MKNELQSIDWKTALSINNNDVNQSLENFLNISNSLLDKYAPLKQTTKKQMKTNSIRCITKGFLTSIRKKYKIHSKFVKAKDQKRKEALNQEYKMYKNLLTKITKKSQENYYKQNFKDNKNNLIKVWEGINEIILSFIYLIHYLNSITSSYETNLHRASMKGDTLNTPLKKLML